MDGRAGRSPRPTATFEATGSHVSHQSLSQARATSMPGTAWAVGKVSPRLLPEVTTLLGFDAVCIVSTRHQWFTHVRLLGSHLTHYLCALSATLTTTALYRRSVRWFEASPCRAAPEDLPPSLMQPASVGFDPLHRSLLQPSWRTVVAKATPTVGHEAVSTQLAQAGDRSSAIVTQQGVRHSRSLSAGAVPACA